MLKREHWEIIRFKVYADLHAETSRTYMGFLWWVIDPLLFMAIFYLVFSMLLQRGTENFVQFLLVGLVFWRWFLGTVNGGANTIFVGRTLMRQAFLPKVILPLVSIFSDLVKFSLTLILLLVLLWLSGFGPTLTYFALPVVMVVQFSLIVGVTCFVAALVPLIPDLRHLVGHLLHLLFFLSGIFFSVEHIPDRYLQYFYLNPMAVLLATYRNLLMYHQWPDWSAMAWIFALGLAFYAAAGVILTKLEHEYPKLVP